MTVRFRNTLQAWRSTVSRLVTVMAIVVFTTACASKGSTQSNPDPLEPINRPIYKFNDGFDRWLLRPTAKGYDFITPDPIQTGVANFFDNITYPVTIVNALLQGKFKQGLEDTGRFLMNSTLGLGGLLDPATDAGLVEHTEDFGQTFAKWGIPSGPYIVIPLLGPSNFRDGIGILANVQVNPLIQYDNSSVRDKLLIFWAIETRAGLLGVDEQVSEAFDPYLFLRDAYTQNREFLIYDGNPPESDFDEWEDFDDEFEDEFNDEDFEDGDTTTKESEE
ncbi:MAG: MlaA family lipoprotein [Gammaproteobacteria bacterium]